jgi:Putative prokaryotic signal transducing protein
VDHSKLTVIDRFASQVEADLAKSALESAGIDATIQADRAGGMRDHLAWSGLGFKVLVREEDAPEARELLRPPQNASAEPAPPNDENSASSKPSN